MIHYIDWKRCPVCKNTYADVPFLPWRVAGFCTKKCQDSQGKKA